MAKAFAVLCAYRKQNASDKINLQHIMELRELFEAADTDKGGALEIDEFTEAFGGVLGKGMNEKQLKQLFMKIDADSNGSVGKLNFSIVIISNRVARVHELHAAWEPDSIFHEAGAFWVRENQQARSSSKDRQIVP